MESIYVAFAVSVIRTALTFAGAWLVQRGMVEDGLMREVAAGLALVAVTQVWGFWRAHQRALYQRWLLWLGMQEPSTADPDVMAAVKADAKFFTQEGLSP